MVNCVEGRAEINKEQIYVAPVQRCVLQGVQDSAELAVCAAMQAEAFLQATEAALLLRIGGKYNCYEAGPEFIACY